MVGLRASPQADADRSPLGQIGLYLSTGSDRTEVGRLWKEGDEFVFEYSTEFQARTDLPTVPDFPDRDRAYRSPDLWPFFLARLPPSNRPDVEQAIREKGIGPQNTLELLAFLGRRAISSPYELELTHQH